MINLLEDGFGGRRYIDKKDETPWNFCKAVNAPDDDDEDTDSTYEASEDESSVSSGIIDNDESDEDVNFLSSEMTGNRLVEIANLCNKIRENLCCKKCAVENHKKQTRLFLSFARSYDEEVKKEEEKLVFDSELERLKWKLEKKVNFRVTCNVVGNNKRANRRKNLLQCCDCRGNVRICNQHLLPVQEG